MSRIVLADWPSSEPILRLPHPYQTPYFVSAKSTSTSSSTTRLYQLSSSSSSEQPPPVLENSQLYFSQPQGLKSSDRPADSINTAWARARRSPATTVAWDAADAPTLAQAWLVLYALFTIAPSEEFIRLVLDGQGKEALANQLRASMLAVNHPRHSKDDAPSTELVLLRASFWQGAGSPFGARSVWVPSDGPGTTYGSQAMPALDYMLTDKPGTALAWHPRRAPKPRPGSTIYSRWIPHLGETFSMVALDHTRQDHVDLFHTWQNDPRVSHGWNQAGTRAAHCAYLAQLHEDPAQVAVLAAFDGVFFAYFELYWAREGRLGAYYASQDFDRGRHSLVGDVRYRGAHRVGAWWSSLMHYLFLDDARTMQVVGEPKFTNTTVLAYDFQHGFGADKFVDLPDKRGALMKCSRERFFQICPLAGEESGRNNKVVGGTQVGLVAKL
ncbi:acyl-CoA N-acyltransferase [Coniella lustricola]|uniref:Acyl-CoA N-acyltransferase n=1 Tax=Coniella lustricola TaxID=2025994 RepID=A0A2T2ZRW9_9PEZI|nr:acyl-CoA N-acyltransferase [Coniella lustricola]